MTYILKRVIQNGREKVVKCATDSTVEELAEHEKVRRTLCNKGKRNQIGCLIEAILNEDGTKNTTETAKLDKLSKPDTIEGY